MKVEIFEQTKRWMEKADRDLMAAEKLLEAGIYDYSLFHSQQAVEKYLKAFLTFHNKPFGKTHDLTYLLKKCIEIDVSFHELREVEIDKLYPKGIEVRYPEFTLTVTEDDAKESIKIAEKVREFVLEKVE